MLKLQYFGHLMQRPNSWKRADSGKVEGRRKTVIEEETVKDREAWHAAVHGVGKSGTQLSYLTTILF